MPIIFLLLSGVAGRAADTAWVTVLDRSAFRNYSSLEAAWNYGYPWGNDHNGSARMTGAPGRHANVRLSRGLLLEATPVRADEGKSSSPPHLQIRYHSGAVFAKTQVLVDETSPVWELSVRAQAPWEAGTWPAFWITAVHGWPPESDILELKGRTVNWQNTFITPRQVFTRLDTLVHPARSHRYAVRITRLDSSDVRLDYSFDGRPTASHRANFTGKPMWIILNLQMEGSSEGKGPDHPVRYRIRDLLVRKAVMR